MSTLSQRLNETAKMESANLPPKTNAKTHSKIKAKANFQTLDQRDQHTFHPNAKMNAKISAKTDQPMHHKNITPLKLDYGNWLKRANSPEVRSNVGVEPRAMMNMEVNDGRNYKR